MRRVWRRLLSGVLAAVMALTMLPATACAAVSDLVRRSAVENAALLQALQEVYGDDAESYLAVLRQYGLVDGDGNIVTDEKIVMNGVAYTLDQIEMILDAPDTDLSVVVEVDGTFLTLEELKTIVEIERYLAYIKAAYFTEQDLTDEQVSSFYNLAAAWAAGGVKLLTADALNGVGPAGVDHDVRLTVNAAATAPEKGTYTVTVTPTRAQTKDVTFSWRALGGSVKAAGGGEVVIPAGSTTSVELTVSVGEVKGQIQGGATFLVQFYGLTNALFSNGSSSFEQKVMVSRSDSFKYYGTTSTTLSSTDRGYYAVTSESEGIWDVANSILQNSNPEIQADSKTLSISGLSDGTYLSTITFGPGTFTRKEINCVIPYSGSTLYPFWNIVNEKYNNTFGDYREIPASYELLVDDRSVYSGNIGSFKSSATQRSAEQTVTRGSNTFYSVAVNTSGFYCSGMINTSNYWLAFYPDVSIPVTLTMKETTNQTTAAISAPAGTYYPGQSVPITVTFGFPMKINNNLKLTVNGDTTLTPVETGTTGTVCTFLYPVTDTSGASVNLTAIDLNGTGANDNAMTVSQSGDLWAGGTLPGVSLVTPDRTKTFTSYNLAVQLDENNKPQLVVTVGLNQDESTSGNKIYLGWLNQQLGEGTITSLQVVTDQTGEGTAYPFTINTEGGDDSVITAVIDLPYNQSEDPATLTADFLLDGAVLMGKGLTATVPGSVLVKAGDITPKLTVTKPDGEGTDYLAGQEVPLLYAQQDNVLNLSFTLARSGYTWGNTNSVTYYKEDGTPANKAAHFAWKSSNLTVASVRVDSEGNASVVPTGNEGDVTFTLVALNGEMADAESAGITVNFAAGQDPFLLIPTSGSSIRIREGQDALVSWSSNICAKNETAGEDGAFVPTTFQVSLYSGSENRGELVWTRSLTTDEDNRTISSVTIPWEGALAGLYAQGVRAATVTVSAMYHGVTYGTYYDTELSAWMENATATIQMISQPASVTLDPPQEGLYQTDGGTGKSVTLTWTVPHLDTVTNGQFELYIASDALEKPISVTTVGDEGGVTQNGDVYSYTLTVPAVTLTSGPSSYRDSYTITVKAKNSADTTWAYDSYVLYVYSDSALRLLLDGGDAGGSHTMSNVEKIAGLWGQGGEAGSQAIVALQRDIALKNVVSINYGEYAWAELADQIAWRSSDSAVATVNYQQGTLYENIENFSYTSYRPSTDFILSGLQDGRTTITATHVKTGITDAVTVEVETLRDQLYLFQCYPKTETALTYEVYTSAAKTATEEYVLKTNENGEAAIYAPYGIAGDVYCKSTVQEDGETVTYLGTIYNRSLVSSEADSTKLQLYPVNTLQLRRAAYADIYLKNPDGTNYTGSVTVTGGVYRQGEYCTTEAVNGVLLGLQDKKPAEGASGEVAQTVHVGTDGHLRITMDISQFTTESRTTAVQAGEKLYYLFQLQYGDGSGTDYYPMLIRMDATLNLEDVAASGDSIVVWEKNENKGAVPFVAMQTIQYSQSSTANVADVRKSTGYIGPSTTFPTEWLKTTVMWWGDEEALDAGRANKVTLRDTTGKEVPQQTSSSRTYPFSDFAFTENVTRLDASGMTSWGVDCYQKRSVNVELSKDGSALDRSLALSFQVVNMIGATQAEEAGVLPGTLDEIKRNLNADTGDTMSGGDALIQMGLALAAGDAKYDTEQDTFVVRLFATSDPTVFRAFFCLNVGNMESGGNVSGVYPDYTDAEDMAFAQTESAAKKGDFDYTPNVMNVYQMIKDTYKDNVLQEIKDADARNKMRNFSMDLGGYFEADIAYNSATGQWECRPVSGGFHAGGGLSYSWYVNMVVGVVPVNISLTLGGTVEVSMDMQRGNYYTVTGGREDLANSQDRAEFAAKLEKSIYTENTANDYLTTLRVFLYIRVFAGLGFDASVVAFKIGVFGQLNADFNFKWLNRSYLKDKNNISAVGKVDTRTDPVMAGQEPRFSGSTGIEFVFKFLFISYEQVFCSVGFGIDGQYGDWEDIEEIWAANKKINNRPVTRMAMPNGQVMYAIDLGAQLESRDYVDAAGQVWVGGRPSISLFSLDKDQNETLAKALQTGAYSYANPVLSDDGAVMFYLSDQGDAPYDNAKDVTNTRVAVSTKLGTQFQEGKRFDDGYNVAVGYGDSNVKVAGSSGGYAAVWVRQMEDFTLASGDGGTLDEGQQMLQMNSTEIIAATSTNGSSWTLTRLTNNSTPDLAPVAATNGGRTVVAWREVSSTSSGTLTSFNQQDAIRYKVYDGKNWSDMQTLYDGTGTAASVRGIEAAMLSDGTAAVVYTLDTGDQSDNTDWETVVALIPAAETSTYSRDDSTVQSEDTVRTFRLTTNGDMDENPQITTAKFDDGQERFVVAWHTERSVSGSGETESDIRLTAMDKDGVLYENMPESLGRATDGTGDTIGSNFRFAKNAEDIGNLSILWVDTVSGSADETQYTDLSSAVAAGYKNTGHDVLKAVKLVEAGNSFTVSGAVEVAEMEKNTLIDHFDAYMSGDEVKSVILGTNYDQTTERQVTISDGDNEETATITVANPISGMYTAAAQFTNQIQETAVMLEYDKLYPNSDIDVQFTIRNTGKDAVMGLSITSADGRTTYYSTANDPLYNGETGALNLLPNRDVTVTAKVPTGDAIVDTGYVIKAAFVDQSEPVTLSGTLCLDIPDVGISRVETVKQADGERTLRYSLYNALSAKLADARDSWRVQVGFYADQDCTTPLQDKDGSELVRTIDQLSDLALIDVGGYSAEVTIPVASYVAEGEEIPGTGIPIYVKAWIEAPVSGTMTSNAEYGSVYEYLQFNNATSLTLDNLAVRKGEDVTLSHIMSIDEGSTSVEVTAQYNKLTGTASGNLIVTLLDAHGNPIAKQQSYTREHNLLTLSREGSQSQTFQFDGITNAASALVEFSNLILNGESVELDHISLTGAAVTYDPDTKTYTATGAGLTSGVLGIAPKDPQNATISFNGTDYDVARSTMLSLPYGTTEWEIIVTNGENRETYTLVLNNTDTRPSSGGTSIYPVEAPEVTDHGTVSVSPKQARSGQTVTITAKPDEGYQVGDVTVTRGNGTTVAVTDKGDGVYTFTMPNSRVTVDVTFVPVGTVCDGGADCPSRVFTDLSATAWYHEAVDYVLINGIMGGYGGGLFGPDDSLSRAQLCQILYNREGQPTVTASSLFTDVADTAWYADAVIWASSKGIVGGYGGGLFGPNDPITREQLAAILWRYAGSPASSHTLTGYTDAEQISSWAMDAMLWANENGILNGDGSGHVAQMIRSFIKKWNSMYN